MRDVRNQPERSSWLAVALLVAMVVAPPAPVAVAGPDPNDIAALILHAVPHAASNHCFTPQDAGFDCTLLAPANVSVTAYSSVDIYLYVRNYDDLRGLQCAFEWPLEWQFNYWWPGSLGGCRSQQILGATPQAPGGATSGTLAAVFDCITSGYLAPIGYMNFDVGPGGCLGIIDSSYPYATHVLSCTGEVTYVAPITRGRVCVDTGGIDTCEFAGPVTTSTWGQIKSTYHR